MKKYIILILISLLFISCKEENEYDLAKDYCGYIVVQREIKRIELNNYFSKEFKYVNTNKYLLLKDSIYKTVILPEYYNYKLGDTICNENKDSIVIYRNLYLKTKKKLKEEEAYSNYLIRNYR